MPSKLEDRKMVNIDIKTYQRFEAARGDKPLAGFLRDISKILVPDDSNGVVFNNQKDMLKALKKQIVKTDDTKVQSVIKYLMRDIEQDIINRVEQRVSELESWVLPGRELLGVEDGQPVVYDASGEDKEAMAKSDADQQQRIQAILDERKRRGIQ